MPDTDEDKWWEREPSFEELEANAKIVIETPSGCRDGNGVNVDRVERRLRMSPLERVRCNHMLARAITETVAAWKTTHAAVLNEVGATYDAR